MKRQLSPAQKATADQLISETRTALNEVRAVLPGGDREVGIEQNTADHIAYLCQVYDPAFLAAMVITAAREWEPPCPAG